MIGVVNSIFFAPWTLRSVPMDNETCFSLSMHVTAKKPAWIDARTMLTAIFRDVIHWLKRLTVIVACIFQYFQIFAFSRSSSCDNMFLQQFLKVWDRLTHFCSDHQLWLNQVLLVTCCNSTRLSWKSVPAQVFWDFFGQYRHGNWCGMLMFAQAGRRCVWKILKGHCCNDFDNLWSSFIIGCNRSVIDLEVWINGLVGKCREHQQETIDFLWFSH